MMYPIPHGFMTPTQSRRSFIKALAASSIGGPLVAASNSGPLIAYVGTYTSPLQNMRATQVDLPPGNGRGIHLFEVDRATGAMTPCGLVEMERVPVVSLSIQRRRIFTPAMKPSGLETMNRDQSAPSRLILRTAN